MPATCMNGGPWLLNWSHHHKGDRNSQSLIGASIFRAVYVTGATTDSPGAGSVAHATFATSGEGTGTIAYATSLTGGDVKLPSLVGTVHQPVLNKPQHYGLEIITQARGDY